MNQDLNNVNNVNWELGTGTGHVLCLCSTRVGIGEDVEQLAQ